MHTPPDQICTKSNTDISTITTTTINNENYQKDKNNLGTKTHKSIHNIKSAIKKFW